MRISKLGLKNAVTTRIRSTLLRGRVASGLLAAATVTMLGLSASPAAAQSEATAGLLEEVVVTARKREETLLDIPVAVTAISAADIEARGIESLQDVALFTPGLTYFDALNSALGTPVVRGIAQTNLNSPDRNVAVFYGGVYLANLSATNLEILDVSRIEVVKGPQSALYGRNAFNGAINYVPASPTQDFYSRVEGTVGTDERYEAKLILSGPFTDTFAGRLAVSYNEFDGSWENAAERGNNIGGYETKNVSGTLEWKPTEEFTARLFGFYTDDYREQGAAYFASANNCGPPGRPLSAVCGEIPVRDTLSINPFTEGLYRDVVLTAFDLEYEFGPVRLSGETARYDASVDIFTDYDLNGTGSTYDIIRTADVTALAANPTIIATAAMLGLTPTQLAFVSAPALRRQAVPQYNGQGIGDTETFSQELRLESTGEGPFQWALGAFYYKNDYNSAIGVAWDGRVLNPGEIPRDALGGFTLTPGVVSTTPRNVYITGDNIRKDVQKAVFGSFEWDFAEQFTLGAELRRDKEDRQQYNRLIGASSRQRNEFEYTTWRAHFDYALSPAQKFYVSAAKGVISGYFNSTFDAVARTAVPVELQSYDPAQNKTYEFGWKAEWLDRRLSTELALFYIDYTGIQINATPPPPLVTNLIQNLGKAEARGIEISANFAITDRWRIGGTYGYSPTEFGNDTPEPGVARYCGGAQGLALGFCPSIVFRGQTLPNVEGQSLPRAPELTASAYTSFEVPLAGDWRFFGRADVSHTSKAYTLTWNLAEIPARTLANMRVGVRKGPLDVALWGRNIFDEKYVSAVIFQPSFATALFVPNVSQGDRATWGITASYSFGGQ
jgi:iron complex outermembrane receptor protein